jgi:hypothetical protein
VADEPTRTLDAIRLASALVARTAIAGLMLLSLDDRVRKAGKTGDFGADGVLFLTHEHAWLLICLAHGRPHFVFG